MLGEKFEAIQKAYWINNPLLTTQFEIFLNSTSAKHQLNPDLFNSQGWTYSSTDPQLKREYMRKLEGQLSFSANRFQTTGIVPVIQGTRENSAHRIAKNGFGTVATLDLGWYGQGIYFTNRMAYASVYSTPTNDGSLVFVLGLACPGNALPVTETPFLGPPSQRMSNPQGFLGKPCQRGYQSHYAVVDFSSSSTIPQGYPLKEPPTEKSFDELVVFESAQVLPLFLVYVNKAKGQLGLKLLFSSLESVKCLTLLVIVV